MTETAGGIYCSLCGSADIVTDYSKGEAVSMSIRIDPLLSYQFLLVAMTLLVLTILNAEYVRSSQVCSSCGAVQEEELITNTIQYEAGNSGHNTLVGRNVNLEGDLYNNKIIFFWS